MRALVLFALLVVGCASSKSIPTSSDAKVSTDVVTAKGGTIACAVMMRVDLDPATGIPTRVNCDQNGAFTDPPTAEETTALSQFGASLLEALTLPLRMLGAMAQAAGGVAPQP